MINIIAAAAKNGVIGSKGRIPWDIPEDRVYFRDITVGGIVIMGRKTFEEIGKPLPERFNIIVSKTKSYSGKTLCTAKDLEEAMGIAVQYNKLNGLDADIFICGGGEIYAEGLKYAQRIYLTELDDEYEGDTYFPSFSKKDFRCIKRTRNDELKLFFSIYEK